MDVHLEPLVAAHFDALRSIALRDDFGPRYATVPESRAAFDNYVQTARNLARTGQAHVYTIVAHGEVVGTTRLVLESWASNPDRETPTFMRANAQAGEVGWTWLSPEARGTGLNSACKLQILTQAFEQLGLLLVTFKSDARNGLSRRAIEKLGARLDGVLRAYSCAWDNTVRDTAIYSLLASEWPDAKAALLRRPITYTPRGQE